MKTNFSIVDEVGWVAVRLPADATPLRSQAFVTIATIDNPRRQYILAPERRLPFLDRADLFSLLCSEQAQMVLDGHLRCRGAVVTPEQYLRTWRRALAASVTPHELYEQRGWNLVVRLEGPLDHPALLTRKSAWLSCPFQTFEAFTERYESRMSRAVDRFVVDIDLA